MNGFACPHCGEIIDVFPIGQQKRAILGDLPILATIPLHPPMAVAGDNGKPVVIALPESVSANAFHMLATKVARALNGPPKDEQ